MPANMNHYDAAIRICVDQVTDGRICGRVVSRRLLRPFSFSDIGGLLLQLEEVLDTQNFPQAFERTRTFCPGRGEGCSDLVAKDLNSGMSREEVEAARGEAATFQLYVITRRNTTWQGFLDWLDGTPRQEYASVLELIKCVDERLSGKA